MDRPRTAGRLVTDTTSDETISSTEDQKRATPSGDEVALFLLGTVLLLSIVTE